MVPGRRGIQIKNPNKHGVLSGVNIGCWVSLGGILSIRHFCNNTMKQMFASYGNNVRGTGYISNKWTLTSRTGLEKEEGEQNA